MRASTISNIFISIIGALGLSGCYSMYYAPNAQNVPMFKERNEARISAAYCTTGDGTGYNSVKGIEVQGAFAAGKHFAIMFNGFKASSTENADLYASGIRHQNTQFIEGGAGYFKTFARNKVVVEAYGGFGSGEFKNRFISEDDPSHTIYSSASFNRYFVQPSIGFSSHYIGAAFSLRVALLDYTKNPQFDFRSSYFLAEPCFTIRAGSKSFKFQSQIQFSNNLTDQQFPQHHININTGIYIILPVKKSAKQKSSVP